MWTRYPKHDEKQGTSWNQDFNVQCVNALTDCMGWDRVDVKWMDEAFMEWKMYLIQSISHQDVKLLKLSLKS